MYTVHRVDSIRHTGWLSPWYHITKKKVADLFVFRVVKRSSGVKNGLLCIVEQLGDVFQVLRRTLEKENQQREYFSYNYLHSLKADCVHVSRCIQTAEIRNGGETLRLQSYLDTCLNLRELVHDGEDGFHRAPAAQIRLVSHKDDGNSEKTCEDSWLSTNTQWRLVTHNNQNITIQDMLRISFELKYCAKHVLTQHIMFSRWLNTTTGWNTSTAKFANITYKQREGGQSAWDKKSPMTAYTYLFPFSASPFTRGIHLVLIWKARGSI